MVENRKARHDFFIEETYEAGLALVGTEVKALRAHKANLRDSYARVKDGELFLHGIHIGAYAPAGQFSHKETRPRKLLLHRREINRLWGRVRERGYSIVPLQIYFKDGRRQQRVSIHWQAIRGMCQGQSDQYSVAHAAATIPSSSTTYMASSIVGNAPSPAAPATPRSKSHAKAVHAYRPPACGFSSVACPMTPKPPAGNH